MPDMVIRDGQSTVHDFLRSVVGHDIHLVAIRPDADSEPHGAYWGDDAAQAAEWVRAYNAAGWNVYWTVNQVRAGLHSKPAKSDIVAARFVHCDVDPPRDAATPWDRMEALGRITAANPSVIVDSGNGWQVLWRLARPVADPLLVEGINRAAIAALGGDAHCWNIDRLLRIPGTTNYPDAAKRLRGRLVTQSRLALANDLRFMPDGLWAPLAATGATAADRSGLDLGEWRPLLPAELLPLPDERLLAMIQQPHGTDRSGDVARLAAEMMRRGYSAEQTVGILMHPANAVHAHIADQSNQLRAASRAVAIAADMAPSAAFGGSVALPAGASAEPILSDGEKRQAEVIAQLGEPPRTDKNSHLCAMWWARAMGGHVRYDAFANRIVMPDGSPLDDNIERDLWFKARSTDIKFPKELFGDALRQIAWENQFHPVRDYLTHTQGQWDGRERIDRWLVDFAGAEDSAYTRAVGRMFLLAAVRSARVPGVKYDEMMVLEGPQGTGKSSLYEALCPDPSWFTDNVTMNMPTRDLVEVIQGKWIVEAPELSKLRGAEIEHVKAMLSRRTDRVRPAYGRHIVEMGRCSVFGGTTNALVLQDRTGNRRFLPVVTGAIDLPGLRAARDQLWAEAATQEAAGESIGLPPALWAIAAEIQSERVAEDPVEISLEALLDGRTGRVKASVLWDAMHIPLDRRTLMLRSFGESLRSMGWERKRISIDGQKIWYYIKGGEAREIIYEMGKIKYAEPMVREVP